MTIDSKRATQALMERVLFDLLNQTQQAIAQFENPVTQRLPPGAHRWEEYLRVMESRLKVLRELQQSMNDAS